MAVIGGSSVTLAWACGPFDVNVGEVGAVEDVGTTERNKG